MKAGTRKWLKIGTGVSAVVSILAFFQLLIILYGFQITDLTGDINCKGTFKNPCISDFDIRNPNPYYVDIYNQNQVKLNFSPEIYDYALFVKDGRCSATGKCACELKDGRLGFDGWRCVDFTNKTKPRRDKNYTFRFPAYTTKHFRIAGIKNNQKDTVKWGINLQRGELDPIWYPENAYSPEFSYISERKVFLRQYRGLEKWLLENITWELNETHLNIDLTGNVTVWNFISDSCDNPTLAKCLIAEPYIQEDYPEVRDEFNQLVSPAFNCSNATHRQMLLTKACNFKNKGFKVIHRGIEKGYVNRTGKYINISLPISTLSKLDLIELGESSVVFQYEEFTASTSTLTNVTLENNFTHLEINNDTVSPTSDEIYPTAYTDNNGGDNLTRVQADDDDDASQAEDDANYIDLRYGLSLSDGPTFFNVSCEHWESDADIEIYWDYSVNNGSSYTTKTAVTVSEASRRTDSFLISAVDTAGEANGFVFRWKIERNGGGGDIGYLDYCTLNYTAGESSNIYDGLVLYSPFDDDQSTTATYDYAGFNDGSYNGDAKYTASGRYGGAVILDGTDDFIDTVDSTTQDMASGFAVCLWIDPVNVDAAERIVYRYDDTSNDGYYLSISTSGSGAFEFTVFVNSAYDQVFSDDPPSGGWQHVCGVRANDGTTYMYVDSAEQADTGSKAGAIDSDDGLRIGTDRAGNWDLNATVDEIMLFNNTITGGQVTKIFNNQSKRFKGTGTQMFNFTNSTPHNYLNVTTVKHQELADSNMTIIVDYYDDNLGSWQQTSEEDFTDGTVVEFTTTNATFWNVSYLFYAGDTTNIFYSPALFADINFTIFDPVEAVGDPGINYFSNIGGVRFFNCSPDWEFYPTYPIGQSATVQSINATNNGTVSGDMQIKVNSTLATGWELYSCNASATEPKTNASCITLSTSYQTIWNDLAVNNNATIWLYGNCSYITSNPNSSIEMQAV
jgi:hypothetical protein